jgi:hypothetical protein
MIKWFAYIVLLLIFAPYLSSAKVKYGHHDLIPDHAWQPVLYIKDLKDTIINKKRQQDEDEKKKIKEVSKAKRQSKPEKIGETVTDSKKAKPKRERRPEGMERPPEIPRRNGN